MPNLTAMYKKLFLPILSFFLFSTCTKEEEVSKVPAITFKSITPSTYKAGTDSLFIVFSYSDVDGDLGEDSVDAKNMFVTDNRNSTLYQFRVKQLVATGTIMAIKGDIQIKMPNVGITNGVTNESATFNVYIKDRAGNKSNTIITTAITVTGP